MCRILLWRLRKGYMRSDGKKADYMPLGDFAVLHSVGFDAVRLEFLSKLFSFFGIDTHGVQSGGVFSAPVVQSGCAAGTGGLAG